MLPPVTRRRNDRLMFADHLLEILDHLQRDVVFFLAEIDKRARVRAAFGNDNFDRTVRINPRRFNRRGFIARRERKDRNRQSGIWNR